MQDTSGYIFVYLVEYIVVVLFNIAKSFAYCLPENVNIRNWKLALLLFKMFLFVWFRLTIRIPSFNGKKNRVIRSLKIGMDASEHGAKKDEDYMENRFVSLPIA